MYIYIYIDMNPNYGKRLSNISYERPENTITELMQTPQEIKEQLKGYVEINGDDIFYSLNTPVKYITYDLKTNKELFRFGGTLVKIEKDYVVLSGKEGMRFSVQRYIKNNGNVVYNTRFFKRMTENDQIKNKYEEVLLKTHDLIDEKDKIIKKQQKEITLMMKKINKMSK